MRKPRRNQNLVDGIMDYKEGKATAMEILARPGINPAADSKFNQNLVDAMVDMHAGRATFVDVVSRPELNVFSNAGTWLVDKGFQLFGK